MPSPFTSDSRERFTNCKRIIFILQECHSGLSLSLSLSLFLSPSKNLWRQTRDRFHRFDTTFLIFLVSLNNYIIYGVFLQFYSRRAILRHFSSLDLHFRKSGINSANQVSMDKSWNLEYPYLIARQADQLQSYPEILSFKERMHVYLSSLVCTRRREAIYSTLAVSMGRAIARV